MSAVSPFRVDVRVDPSGTPVSPRMRVGTLADRSASYTVDLIPSGALDRIDIDVRGGRWRLTVPAGAEASLSFRLRRGEPVVRLSARVAIGVALRAPARRGPGEIPGAGLQASGEAELIVDLPAPAEWTLARATKEIARLVDPRRWSGTRGALVPGATWRLGEEIPLQLSASARVRRVLAGPPLGPPQLFHVPAAVEIEARLARLDRVQAELRVLASGALQGRLTTLRRRQRGLAGQLELGWRLADAEGLTAALVDAVGPEVADAARRLHRLLADVRELQRGLEALPEEIRALGGRTVGPGSRLERLELRLEEIEALLAALGASDRRRHWLVAVRGLRERVASVRAEASRWIEAVAELAEELDPDERLPRFAAGLARIVERLGRMEGELVEAAGAVLAEGLSVELTAAHRRTAERKRIAEFRLGAGGSPAAAEAVNALVTGRIPDLLALAGQPGVEKIGGAFVTAAKRRRTRGVRLRIGPLGVDRRSIWTGEIRVTRSHDGAVELRARERLERTRRRFGPEELSAILVDLVVTGRLGRVDPSLTLRWSQDWKGRRTRERAELMLARTVTALELHLAPEPLPREPGTLQVRSRLEREAISAALRPDASARRFADSVFWPAWATAIESGYRLLPPPLLRPGRHPLRSQALRRALRRDPTTRTVAERLPSAPRLEREAIAADWRVGRALLEALQAARRALAAPDALEPERLAALGRRLLRALRHAGTVDLVPLIALTALVPPERRQVDVRILPP
jgi:hypothetical protein